MRKLTAILVASSVAFGAASFAHANETPKAHGHEAHMMKGERGPRAAMHEEWMFKDLNLTDAQKKQIDEIRKTAREAMHKQMMEQRSAMHAIIAAESFDATKAQAQVDKQAEVHKAMMLSRMETQNKIYNILTAEQKKHVNENFEKHLNQKMMEPEDKSAAE